MNRIGMGGLLFLIPLLWVPATPAADPADSAALEPTRMFLSAVTAYRNNDFQTAVNRFSALVESGIQNGRLYYNLGCAHLKNGDLGRAVLWFERAKRLLPNDPELIFNLKYARSLTRDQRDDSGASSVRRILFFWKYHLSPKTIRQAAVFFSALYFLLLGFRRISNRRLHNALSHFILVFALLFSATAFINHYGAAFAGEGVILPESISVRSGLDDKTTELFVLHAGTKVTVQKETMNRESGRRFYRVMFSRDKIGWVPADAVGIIRGAGDVGSLN
jgi:tetratricopeptide (TPR) repeat protein